MQSTHPAYIVLVHTHASTPGQVDREVGEELWRWDVDPSPVIPRGGDGHQVDLLHLLSHHTYIQGGAEGGVQSSTTGGGIGMRG